jgi:phosphoserine phosphatase
MLYVDRWIATRPAIVDGKYTGDLDFYAYGQFKAQAMQELADELEIDLESSFAYSDSATDMPMLLAVGRPVVVNPDRELRRIAVARDWRIESFRNPVALRDRLPQIRAPEVTVGNSMVAAAGVAGVAALAWWLAKRSTEKTI